ncbi:MAG: helix-turn-helix domain-containing protein [Corynebacterium sp.]|nr:helix-turn-helix domain-containing protein [Corynebacterium sp.]
MPSKWNRTHTQLQTAALELFTQYGYSATTTAQIAAHVGLSEMTLFRHFPTKESLVLQDPFDPTIATAIAQQPTNEPPLQSIITGIRSTLNTFTPELETTLHTRLSIIRSDSNLTATATHSNSETTTAITEALLARDVDKQVATALATAVLAGLAAAILTWEPPEPLVPILHRVLDALAGI